MACWRNSWRIAKDLVDDYSIADIATWPWISRYEYQQMDLSDYPNLGRWYLQIAGRLAVQRVYSVPEKMAVPVPDQWRQHTVAAERSGSMSY